MSTDKKALRAAFNSVDPMGIFFEENVDEYDPEIDDLLKQSVDFSNAVEMKKVLTEIFHRWFGRIEINEKKISELVGKISRIKQ